MVVDRVLLVMVVLLEGILLHEVLVLLVDLLVIVQLVVRVRRWASQEGLGLQGLLGQIGHDRMLLQVIGWRGGGRCGDGRGVGPAIVVRRRVAGAVVVVGTAAAAVRGERSQVAGVIAGVTALLVLVVVKGMEVVIRVGIPVPVPAVRLVEAHVLEGTD